ncbi:TPA: hypothetical protein N2X72_004169 [Escherichia coli]|nr:hypothetical protein [Escherichia coli]
MITVGKSQADLLMTLPRNEAAYAALVQAVEGYTADRRALLQQVALTSLANPAARDNGLRLMGEVDALNDVLDLLKRLTDI